MPSIPNWCCIISNQHNIDAPNAYGSRQLRAFWSSQQPGFIAAIKLLELASSQLSAAMRLLVRFLAAKRPGDLDQCRGYSNRNMGILIVPAASMYHSTWQNRECKSASKACSRKQKKDTLLATADSSFDNRDAAFYTGGKMSGKEVINSALPQTLRPCASVKT